MDLPGKKFRKTTELKETDVPLGRIGHEREGERVEEKPLNPSFSSFSTSSTSSTSSTVLLPWVQRKGTQMLRMEEPNLVSFHPDFEQLAEKYPSFRKVLVEKSPKRVAHRISHIHIAQALILLSFDAVLF
jgi:hypothetical protein